MKSFLINTICTQAAGWLSFIRNSSMSASSSIKFALLIMMMTFVLIGKWRQIVSICSLCVTGRVHLRGGRYGKWWYYGCSLQMDRRQDNWLMEHVYLFGSVSVPDEHIICGLINVRMWVETIPIIWLVSLKSKYKLAVDMRSLLIWIIFHLPD